MAQKTSTVGKSIQSSSPSGVQVLGEWAGAYRDGPSDKIWAGAYFSSGVYIAVWGRRGTSYQSVKKGLGSVSSARREYETKVSEKLGKGYQPVPFHSPLYGNIPSFSGAMGQVPASAGVPHAVQPAAAPAGAPVAQPAREITVASLVAQMQSLTKRLQRAMGGSGDIESLAFEHYQLGVMADMLGEGAADADREQITSQLEVLRVQFQSAKTSTRACALEL